MSFAQPFQDYEILDRVGAGAMGTVFKARHKKLGRIVALKVLRPSLARDVRYVDRLRREARIVAALNHPNIVTGYDIGEEGGYHYFVMEFVEGKSLRGLLSEWGIFPEDQVLKVGQQVAAALDHAFQRNVIHRDIKPGNILIDEAGTVKLTDMGLAKGPADLTLTRDGATVGTPQYISPEQARNPQDVDVRSDLYSLGATLYHMATGQPPFRGETMAEVITQVLHEVPIAPRVINRHISEGMALVIRKLLAKNLRLRYQTPRELLDDLERVGNEQPPQVDESRLSAGEVDRPANVWLWSLGIVAGAALLAAAVWLGMQIGTGDPARESPDRWVQQLREDLQSMPPAMRMARLRVEQAQAPTGTAQALELLQREVIGEMQLSVDQLTQQLRGDLWPAVAQFTRDPQRWPDVREVVAEHVTRRLLLATGLLREQLPAGVHVQGLDRLVADIERLVAERNRGLEERAAVHFEVALPARAEERLRQGDFAGAERVWREGYAGFFDGLRQPLPERVEPAVRAAAEERYVRARDAGLADIDAAEARVAAALLRESDEGIAALRLLLEGGTAPAEVRARTARLRDQLGQAYPSSGRFRSAADPWPGVAARFDALAHELQVRELQWQQRAGDAAIDLAWRAFCDGSADAALGVLGAPQRDPDSLAPLLARHRQTLQSARLVGDAVVRALQNAPPPIPAWPRNGGVPVELRADAGQEPRLQAQVAGGSWRTARITEFRFEDLWQRARAATPDAFSALPAEDLQRGRAVLAMACDELSLLTESMATDDRDFLRDEVWPRLLRVRGERVGTGVDRALALRRLREAFERARAQDQTRELESALATWRAGFAAEASLPETQLATEAGRWLTREKARQVRLQELQRQVPEDARVVLHDDGTELLAEVTLPPSALRGAGEGWQLRGGRLEFACTAPVLADVDRRRLEVDAGLATASRQVAAEVDLAMPIATHGERVYVLEFRGVACAVVASADDRVYAAMVQGESLRTQSVQAALRRALVARLDPRHRAPLLLPGAIHRLALVVDVPPQRRSGTARVMLDGEVLCQELVQIEPSRLPTMVLYPLQDVTIDRVRLRAIEL
ncbi:MAG: protein kinase [Planctomycetota bacterium]